MVLGIINGGIGIKVSNNTIVGGIAYGIVAGISVVTVLGIGSWTLKIAKK